MTGTARGHRPLDGLRVIDCATFIAGPFCATQLAEFGAEVIKVELPVTGDPVRKFGSKTDCGETLVWLSEGRNKKSVTLDLRKPEGAEIFKKLVAKADVLVENFQPGTLEKWGLGWDVLKAVNARLVMVRISAYGQTGPYSPKPGFGRIANAFGGISFLAGFPDRPPVTPGSATLADYMAGIYGALGAMFALKALETTGKGQVVDIGLYEPIFRILDELAPAFHMFGKVRQRMGPGTVNVVPHSHYPTKDERWVAIACTNDKIFARLAKVMRRDDVADDGIYGSLVKREAAREEVDQFVSDWTSQHDRDEIIAMCTDGEVPCGPVLAIDEIFEDPQYAARENLKDMADPRIGTLKVPNVVPRLTETPGGIDHLGPSLGQDNEVVLEGLLGLSSSDIEKLRDQGVI
jgi:crotonobetainyl-CoA:carnitine CoA-transferase CaiB-like acyl-CoA transferase